jgi:predicted lipoprotein with Yx(FWY)xxD motif
MKRLLITGAALAASLVLAACGDSASETAAPAGGGQTVAVKSIDGIGDVLVDAGGKALYASDVESDGKVHCTDGCTRSGSRSRSTRVHPPQPTASGSSA